MIDKINIRVYACAVKDKKVLTLFEEYAGEPLMKFPGGGLEYGEGVLECLHREFDEELNVKVEVVEQFLYPGKLSGIPIQRKRAASYHLLYCEYHQ